MVGQINAASRIRTLCASDPTYFVQVGMSRTKSYDNPEDAKKEFESKLGQEFRVTVARLKKKKDGKTTVISVFTLNKDQKVDGKVYTSTGWH